MWLFSHSIEREIFAFHQIKLLLEKINKLCVKFVNCLTRFLAASKKFGKYRHFRNFQVFASFFFFGRVF